MGTVSFSPTGVCLHKDLELSENSGRSNKIGKPTAL